MRLCVGAVSVRVIEEAAAAHVSQIVASRRQVDVGGGYTGLDQQELVDLVRGYGRATDVVRDHGGPKQGPAQDDGVASFDADVAAGFDRLHLDVSKLDASDQYNVLQWLVRRYADQQLEIGGEHDSASHNDSLLGVALETELAHKPTVVLDTGAHIWNDRQLGTFTSTGYVEQWCELYRGQGLTTKGHNLDWVAQRTDRYRDVLDFYNIAPEFSLLETDVLLHVLPWKTGDQLLRLAYDSHEWRRWFGNGEGTYDQRARCAVRYVLELPEVRELIQLDDDQETYVRGRIRAAIHLG